MTGLEKGIIYNVYKYNDEKLIPITDFNSSDKHAVMKYQIKVYIEQL